MRVAFYCLEASLVTLLVTTGASGNDELAKYDAVVKPTHRRHWSFQPVRRPMVPAVQRTDWPRNPIDHFVLAGLEARGWKPSLAAEPRALLRRLYLDLIGLPPTLAEQEAFLRDRSPGAVERLIDSLLARPEYGERWGRHWLDLVRYAETNGYERDATKPHAWRYRDYVIRAFNSDKPFDRFILEQLAGDELPDADAETLIATGYNRLGPWDDEPADPDEDRFDQLDDLVSTTSQVFLGLTLGCARCHNHKFEPLSMHDYYRLVAVFAPLARPQAGRTELDLPVGSRAELASLAERDRRILNQRRQSIAGGLSALGMAAARPGRSPLTATTALAIARERANVGRQRVERLQKEIPELPRGYFLHETSPRPPATQLLIRGKASRPGPEVAPGVPTVLAAAQPAFLSPDGHTTRRRLTLARWIASKDNPLTARVLVNRIWQQHFGEGLVRTPSDFGRNGQPPTHPELLDWLAATFVQEGWSVKQLHRLILTSNTYQMSKKWRPDYGTQDPENKLLWRVPYRRLEAEAVRDSVLAVSGRLDRRMYGPSVYPQVPKEALDGHSDPDKIWPPFHERAADRRTVYAFLKRSLVVPLLEVLDLCDTARSTPKRSVTTVAPQALSLFNGDFVNREAGHLADRLVREVGMDPEKIVERAYMLALCRPPTAAERSQLVVFLKKEKHRGKDAEHERFGRREALKQVCRVLLNLNELAYPD